MAPRINVASKKPANTSPLVEDQKTNDAKVQASKQAMNVSAELSEITKGLRPNVASAVQSMFERANNLADKLANTEFSSVLANEVTKKKDSLYGAFKVKPIFKQAFPNDEDLLSLPIPNSIFKVGIGNGVTNQNIDILEYIPPGKKGPVRQEFYMFMHRRLFPKLHADMNALAASSKKDGPETPTEYEDITSKDGVKDMVLALRKQITDGVKYLRQCVALLLLEYTIRDESHGALVVRFLEDKDGNVRGRNPVFIYERDNPANSMLLSIDQFMSLDPSATDEPTVKALKGTMPKRGTKKNEQKKYLEGPGSWERFTTFLSEIPFFLRDKSTETHIKTLFTSQRMEDETFIVDYHDALIAMNVLFIGMQPRVDEIKERQAKAERAEAEAKAKRSAA